MSHFRFISLLFVVAIVSSCDVFVTDQDPSSKTVRVNNNTRLLANRVSLEGAGVIQVTPLDRRTSKYSAFQAAEIPAGDQPLSKIAHVAPPTHEGRLLTASHVYVDGSSAFVAYNRMGAEYLGAIEILDIRDVNAPKLVSQILFTNMDVSAVFARDGMVYFAGARDVDQFEGIESAAVLGRIELRGNQFTDKMDLAEVPGYVATDITADASRLFVTSGNDGQLTVFDLRSMTEVSKRSESDLRAVAVQENQLAYRSGRQGVTFLNGTTFEQTGSIRISEDAPDAKRTIQFYESMLMVAEGEEGAAVYDIRSNELIKRLPIGAHPDMLDPSDVVTNAVSATDGLIWMANGGAGLSVARLEKSGEFTSLGVAELGGSCNYIQTEGSYIFAAAGAAGLHILHREDSGSGDAIGCEGAVPYTGSSWLNVNSGQSLAYTGAAALQGVNVNAQLSFCGSLSVQEQLNLNSNSTFNMKGSLAFGRYGSGTTLHINSGATLRVEGSLVIWGNLNLNSGATIEFVGSGSSVAIYGNVTKGRDVTITGSYSDAFNKLK